jgi:hypothetical protein
MDPDGIAGRYGDTYCFHTAVACRVSRLRFLEAGPLVEGVPAPSIVGVLEAAGSRDCGFGSITGSILGGVSRRGIEFKSSLSCSFDLSSGLIPRYVLATKRDEKNKHTQRFLLPIGA